jgi:hypothetical protein
MLFRHSSRTFLLSHGDTGTGELLGKFKEAVELSLLAIQELHSQKAVAPKVKNKIEKRGRKHVEGIFPDLIRQLEQFVEQSAAVQADGKRRKETSMAEFSLRDAAQQHLYMGVL